MKNVVREYLQLLLAVLPAEYHIETFQMTTVSVIVLAAGAFMVLFHVCMPMNLWHILLYIAMLGLFLGGWAICSITIPLGDRALDLSRINLFSMVPMKELTSPMGVYIGAGIGLSLIAFVIFTIFATQIGTWVSKRLMKTLRWEDKA